ncbi:MAG: type II secretion system F family protein [Planctomycetaceae bacterium]
MSFRNCANFCRRVGTGYKAGVDFLRLIDSESKHGSGVQREVMSDVHRAMRNGSQLHAAMKEHPKYFPPLLIAMTAAGEVTGSLDRTLLALADYYDERVKIYREFLSRITWPMIQLVAAVNILALLIWILGILTPPGGGQMFDVLGFGLSGTRGVLVFYGYVLGAALMLAAVIIGFRKNVAGVQNLIPILYKAPVAGEALQTITLARFCWTLALSLEAGIDPIRSLHMSLDATDSDYYRSAKDDVEKSIRGGSTLGESLLNTGVFPDEFVTEVGVAEMSGTDAEAMHHLAAQYDVRSRAAMRTLATLASGAVWAAVVIGMVILIMRMLMNISGAYNEALQPI